MRKDKSSDKKKPHAKKSAEEKRAEKLKEKLERSLIREMRKKRRESYRHKVKARSGTEKNIQTRRDKVFEKFREPYMEFRRSIRALDTMDEEQKEGAINHLKQEFFKAAERGNAGKLHAFIDEGFPVVFQHPVTSETALHMAAAAQARDAVRVLLYSGQCDFLLRDKKGRLASELAYLYGHDPAVARLLRIKEREQAEREGVKLTRRPDLFSMTDNEKMVEIESMEEKIYDKEGQENVLSIQCFANEKASRIDFYVSVIRPDNQSSIEVKIITKIRNPLVIDDVLIANTAKYTLCVSKAIVSICSPLILQAYDESKKNNSDCIAMERAKDFVKRFFKKKTEIKYAVGGAIITCLFGF